MDGQYGIALASDSEESRRGTQTAVVTTETHYLGRLALLDGQGNELAGMDVHIPYLKEIETNRLGDVEADTRRVDTTRRLAPVLKRLLRAAGVATSENLTDKVARACATPAGVDLPDVVHFAGIPDRPAASREM